MIRYFTVIFEDCNGGIRQTTVKGSTVDQAMDSLARRNRRKHGRRRVVILLWVYEGAERVL